MNRLKQLLCSLFSSFAARSGGKSSAPRPTFITVIMLDRQLKPLLEADRLPTPEQRRCLADALDRMITETISDDPVAQKIYGVGNDVPLCRFGVGGDFVRDWPNRN